MQSLIRNVIVDYHYHRTSDGLVCGGWWSEYLQAGGFVDFCEYTTYFNIGSLIQLLENQYGCQY